MNLQERLETSLRNPYPVLDAEINRLGMFADESYPYGVAAGNALFLLLNARKALELYSASYRNFNVGATVVAYKIGVKDYAIFNGANVKVDETDLINVHAEDTALGKAVDAGYDLVSFVGVVGDVQNDQSSGREIHTLHPCGRCRGRFTDSSLITDQTLFMSANISLTKIEIYTLPGLIAFHDSGNPDGITTIETLPEAEDWHQQVSPVLGRYAQSIYYELNRVQTP